MTTFRVIFSELLERDPMLVEADEVVVESQGMIVLRNTVQVMGHPRTVVARRFAANEVASVDEVAATG